MRRAHACPAPFFVSRVGTALHGLRGEASILARAFAHPTTTIR